MYTVSPAVCSVSHLPLSNSVQLSLMHSRTSTIIDSILLVEIFAKNSKRIFIGGHTKITKWDTYGWTEGVVI